MPKDHMGLYKVTNVREMFDDIKEILNDVYGVDYEGNPKDNPEMYPEAIKKLEYMYADFPDGKETLFGELIAVLLIKLQLQSLEQMQDRQDAAREVMGNDES